MTTFGGYVYLDVVLFFMSYMNQLHVSVRIQFVLETAPQPGLDPPKSEWHDGQRQINEAGKYIRDYTALRTKSRCGVRVQVLHAAVCVEFAFGRLSVITTQAS